MPFRRKSVAAENKRIVDPNSFEAFVSRVISLLPSIDIEFIRYCVTESGCKVLDDSSIVPPTIQEEIMNKLLGMNGFYPQLPQIRCCGNQFCFKQDCGLVNSSLLNSIVCLLMELFPTIGQDHIQQTVKGLLRDGSHDLINRTALILMSQKDRISIRSFGSPPQRDLFFRCPCYKERAKTVLLNQYPDLWKSQITTVLEETDFYYPAAFERLAHIEPPLGFLSRFAGWVFGPRKQLELPEAPHRDFDEDHHNCVQELRSREIAQNEEAAKEIDHIIQEQDGQLIECECCYDEVPPHEMIGCTAGDHLFCCTCLSRYIKESIEPIAQEGVKKDGGEEEGSGLESSPNLASDSPQCVPCLSSDGCRAIIDPQALELKLPLDVLRWYNRTLFLNSVHRVGGHALICPSCDHIQVQLPEVYPEKKDEKKQQEHPQQANWIRSIREYLSKNPIVKIEYKVCEECKLPSCTKCETYHPLQDCPNTSDGKAGTVDALRLFVEQRMSEVSVRVCPECKTRFNKDGGCNLMTCKCSYQMCYVCRKDLRKEGYGHFCQHFRPGGGPKCSVQDCRSCDLYKVPNEDALCVEVAQRAAQEYVALHPHLYAEAQKLSKVGVYSLRTSNL